MAGRKLSDLKLEGKFVGMELDTAKIIANSPVERFTKKTSTRLIYMEKKSLNVNPVTVLRINYGCSLKFSLQFPDEI